MRAKITTRPRSCGSWIQTVTPSTDRCTPDTSPAPLRADHVTRPPGPTPGASVDRHGHLHLRRRTLPDRRPRPDGLSKSDDVRLHGGPTRPDAVPETTGSQWNDHRLGTCSLQKAQIYESPSRMAATTRLDPVKVYLELDSESAPSYRMITTKNEEQESEERIQNIDGHFVYVYI